MKAEKGAVQQNSKENDIIHWSPKSVLLQTLAEQNVKDEEDSYK